jgi:hypothetical protein
MAHSTLHFAAGMAVGSAAALPPLLAAWRSGRRLAPPFARWFVVTYTAGAFAVIPGALRQLGVPDAVCDGPWMNVFFFYHWINALKPGGQTMGPLVLGAMLGVQYALLVAAVARPRRRSDAGYPGDRPLD